ncbi:MAG TPA: NUDIX hydrolase [Desulfomonilaceae bacterium]|nr:NUDIX hydrolase [Desulfomonilaceae bacterium]
MRNTITCPHCGQPVAVYRNPVPTTDVLIRMERGVILIKRKNPPHGWAIPGGFIDYGETAEHAAIREALEETSVKITDLKLFNVYSAPDRDPRQHTISIVFTARGEGIPVAHDDAVEIGVFTRENLPSPLAFDHAGILDDFFTALTKGND